MRSTRRGAGADPPCSISGSTPPCLSSTSETSKQASRIRIRDVPRRALGVRRPRAPRRGGPAPRRPCPRGSRRRHDGARAGDVAREEQRENARLNSDLEDDRGEAHNVVGQHLPKDHEPDDEPDAHRDQRHGSEVELVVAAPAGQAGGLIFARCRGSGGRVAWCASLGAALILHATFVVLGLPLSVVLAVSLCSAVVRAARQTGRKSPSEAICMFIQARTGRQGRDYPRDVHVLPQPACAFCRACDLLSYDPQNPNINWWRYEGS